MASVWTILTTGRSGWFYDSQRSGGILVDIASHQVVQVLAFSGSSRATVMGASVRSEELHGRTSFQVLGEGWLQTESGCTAYMRVDWLTPDGLRSWGDGRLFVLGTAGTIEVRKNLDLAGDPRGRVLLVDEEGERALPVHGDEGEAYFAALLAQFSRAQPPDQTACKLEFEAARLSLALQEECPKVAQF